MVVLIIALKTGMLDCIFSILLKYCVDKMILKNIVTMCHHIIWLKILTVELLVFYENGLKIN